MRNAGGPWLALACRLGIGAIFVLAGGVKLANPGSFAATLLAYNILPVEAIRPFALTLPWVEAGIGLLLIAGLFTRQVAALAVATLVIFSAAIAQALARGLSLDDCGCFGDVASSIPALGLFLGGKDTGWLDVIRDLMYAGIAVVVIAGPDSPFRAESLLERQPLSGDDA